MPKAILDTDILSEVLKGKDAVVCAHAAEYLRAFGRLAISAVTVVEVVKGFQQAQRPQEIGRFLTWLSGVEVVPLDADSAEVAGRIYGDLERTAQPIGRADPMIAGIAIISGATLVTGNTPHYQRICDLGYALEIANWRETP